MHLNLCSTGASRKTIPSLRFTSIRGRPVQVQRETGISRRSSLMMKDTRDSIRTLKQHDFRTAGKVKAVRLGRTNGRSKYGGTLRGVLPYLGLWDFGSGAVC